MAQEDELIAQYSGITGESATKARQLLEAFDWNLELAVEDHYARANDSDNDPDYQDDEPESESVPASAPSQPTQVAGGGYRLGDGPSTSHPVPAASTGASSSSKPKAASSSNKRFATLGDFNASAREDTDDDDDDDPQNFYAGGDKSGLEVQNPNRSGGEDLKKKIIEKARKGGKNVAEEEPKKKSFFTGNAQTLGGDDAPSQEIRGERSAPATERIKRILHFWQDGFSVDDGALFRFDDPANSQILEQIRSGRAPLHIMNVEPGQEVDVQVVPHEEDYVRPKSAYNAFEGLGQRLGSPTPSVYPSGVPGYMPGAFNPNSVPAPPPELIQQNAPGAPPVSQVDDSKPTLTLRISLGTGTRLTSRFNTEQTIGDVYDFVRRAEVGGRNFVLQTTFPSKEFTDKAQMLGDIAEFKRGGAVVQKYT